jgi:hypothetical protein
MSPEEREREVAVHQAAVAKAAAESERETARAERQRQVEGEAERFAAEHGMIAPDPAHHETPAERWRLYGGIDNPETASRIFSDPAKRAGVEVTDMAALATRRATEASFYAKGGGRLPGQAGPPEQPPQRPRIAREWLDDPDCLYDQQSLAMIEQVKGRRP